MSQALQNLLLKLPPEAERILENYLSLAIAEMVSKGIEIDMPDGQVRGYWPKMKASIIKTLDEMEAGTPLSVAIDRMTKEPPYPTHENARACLEWAIKRDKRQKRHERGREIIRLVHAGYRNYEIARRTGLSISTVAKAAAKAKGIKI